MFILVVDNSHGFKHVEFLQICLLSSYTQTHGLKGILEISNSKIPYYFTDNSIENMDSITIINILHVIKIKFNTYDGFYNHFIPW